MATEAEATHETDARVRRLVYDGFLSRAEARSRDDIARALALDGAEVASSFRRLAEAHMLVLQPASGELLMANPFSAVPTAFRVGSGNRQWWANCIWDGLGILAMVDGDGSVQTSCPDCGEALRLQLKAGALVASQAVVHFSVPAARWWDDIVFT